MLLRYRAPLFAVLSLPLLALPACDEHPHHEDLAQVSLSVVVHDVDGYAWQGVEVRILEAWTEWSGRVSKGKEPWCYGYSDSYGRVAFGPSDLANAELGYAEEPLGVAVLGSWSGHDESWARLLIGHDTLGWVEITVPINYWQPHVELFVQI